MTFFVCLSLTGTYALTSSVNCDAWGTPNFFSSFESNKAETVSLETVEECLELGYSVNSGHESKWNMLHYGAKTSYQIIKILIEYGVNVNGKVVDGVSPIHLAAAGNPDPDVMNILISAGANVEAKTAEGISPLHNAARWNENSGVVETLIEAGADVNARDDGGMSPLHLAAQWNRNPDIVVKLIMSGAKLNARNERGETALHLAAERDHNSVEGPESLSEVIEPLTRTGSVVNARDAGGRSPLHRAATPEAVRLLLQAGADVRARDMSGETPLHSAARWAPVDMITLLVDGGADKETKRKDGATAWQLSSHNPARQDTDFRRLLGPDAQ